MSFHESLPHWFLVVVAIVVGWFVFKNLIKFAIIIGAVGVIVWLVWSQGWLEKAMGKLILG